MGLVEQRTKGLLEFFHGTLDVAEGHRSQRAEAAKEDSRLPVGLVKVNQAEFLDFTPQCLCEVEEAQANNAVWEDCLNCLDGRKLEV